MLLNEGIPVITLDGPSGTGKGTLCHRLAEALEWHFLDSGAIYRILAYSAMTKSLALDDIGALVREANTMTFHFKASRDDSVLTYLDKQDVSDAIRTEAIGQCASQIAAIPEVRAALLDR